MADAKQADGAATAERSPEEIEREIERTRRELGETVAAVAEKTDVKAHAQRKADEAKGKVRENQVPLAIAGAVAAAVVVVWIVRR